VQRARRAQRLGCDAQGRGSPAKRDAGATSALGEGGWACGDSLFWTGFGRTRSAPATGGTRASWACSERAATRPLRAGTRRGRAGLARRAPGSLRAASRDGREAAARRACWPRSWAAAGRGLVGEEERRDEGLQGRSERIRWERENGERERGRGELTSSMALRAGCSEVGDGGCTASGDRPRCCSARGGAAQWRRWPGARRGRGRENWALGRKIYASGEENLRSGRFWEDEQRHPASWRVGPIG
jgi:hypothetical protein